MFNYKELEVTSKFYIEFETNNKECKFIATDVEDLIRYWYRSWFNKFSSPYIKWINYNAYSVNDLVEIEVDLNECISKRYVEKDFINKADYVVGDNRNSLRRILTNGVNNSKTKISKVDCNFNIVNNYTSKLVTDIPNPYVINKFNNSVINYKELKDLVNKLIEQEDKKLTELSYELDTNTRYQLMRKQLDKLEVLGKILDLVNELD